MVHEIPAWSSKYYKPSISGHWRMRRATLTWLAHGECIQQTFICTHCVWGIRKVDRGEDTARQRPPDDIMWVVLEPAVDLRMMARALTPQFGGELGS